MLPLYIALEYVVMTITAAAVLVTANGIRLGIKHKADMKTLAFIAGILVIALVVLTGMAVLTGTTDPIQRSGWVYGASAITAVITAYQFIKTANATTFRS